MTNSEKLAMVKTLLEIADNDTDNTLSVYLDLCKTEILSYLYLQLNGIPPSVTDVPSEYEVTQVMAVVAGFNIIGAEGQTVSIENGIHRHFKYSDMVEYVRNHVIPYAGLGG